MDSQVPGKVEGHEYAEHFLHISSRRETPPLERREWEPERWENTFFHITGKNVQAPILLTKARIWVKGKLGFSLDFVFSLKIFFKDSLSDFAFLFHWTLFLSWRLLFFRKEIMVVVSSFSRILPMCQWLLLCIFFWKKWWVIPCWGRLWNAVNKNKNTNLIPVLNSRTTLYLKPKMYSIFLYISSATYQSFTIGCTKD